MEYRNVDLVVGRVVEVREDVFGPELRDVAVVVETRREGIL